MQECTKPISNSTEGERACLPRMPTKVTGCKAARSIKVDWEHTPHRTREGISERCGFGSPPWQRLLNTPLIQLCSPGQSLSTATPPVLVGRDAMVAQSHE